MGHNAHLNINKKKLFFNIIPSDMNDLLVSIVKWIIELIKWKIEEIEEELVLIQPHSKGPIS
jgi:hypothetical protein